MSLACSPHTRPWLGLLIIGALAPTARATPFDILTINADVVDSSYDYQTGLLVIDEDNISLEVKRSDGSSMVFSDAHLNLFSELQADTSAGGFASGLFADGDLIVTDNSSLTDLLIATDVELTAAEVEIPVGTATFRYFAASGSFAVTGGSLKPDFASFGESVTLTFKLSFDPVDLSTASFTGSSKVTLQPVPEPATLLVLVSSAAVPVWMRIRRRAGS